ncbi:MAG: GreA/GreB family elongation factor [Burkholderiaceae bacterium]
MNIQNAIAESPALTSTAFATLDSQVDFEEFSTGKRRSIRLVVPPVVENRSDRVSIFAPMGRALFGLRAGSVAEVMLPTGTCTRLLVVAVHPRGGDRLAQHARP